MLMKLILSLLGMVTSLPPDFFAFLSDLQRNLCRTIKSVGRIEHDFWRSFMNERKTEAMEVRLFKFKCIKFICNASYFLSIEMFF